MGCAQSSAREKAGADHESVDGPSIVGAPTVSSKPPDSGVDHRTVALDLSKAAAAAEEAAQEDGDAAHPWALTFDGGNSFHFGDPSNPIPPGSKRHDAELAAFTAVQAADRVRRPTPEAWAVRLGWLVHDFLPLLPRPDILTHEVVTEVIKPATRSNRVRYIDTLPASDVGHLDVFVSHTWGAPFLDLVAAVQHAVGDESAFVWIGTPHAFELRS
jgi:hypothetical protein